MTVSINYAGETGGLRVNSIILAGGKSLRLGHDKLGRSIGGRRLLEGVVTTVAPLSDEILVVTAGDEVAPFLDVADVRTVSDILPGKGPLGGIYTGLKLSASRHNLVVGADMPFLNPALLRYLIGLAGDADVVAPRQRDKLEPLHAVYNISCLETIEGMLGRGELSVYRLFPLVDVRYVDADEIERLDPRRLSFFNVNTQEDLLRARELAGGDAGHD